MEKQDLSPYIIGMVAVFLGFALCFATAVWMLTQQLKANSYIKTDGIIIDREPHESWDSERDEYVTVYYNLIEYEVNGEKYQKLTETQNNIFGSDKVGDSYTVYYNPDDPTDVLFKTPDRVLMTTVCFIASGALAAGGIAVAYRYVKLKPKKRRAPSNQKPQSD